MRCLGICNAPAATFKQVIVRSSQVRNKLKSICSESQTHKSNSNNSANWSELHPSHSVALTSQLTKLFRKRKGHSQMMKLERIKTTKLK